MSWRVPRVAQRYVIRHTALYSGGSYAGMYEKEGGGLTLDLSEAKVCGWRSKRWDSYVEKGEMEKLPVEIVLRG